jgi:Ca2+/Na+ antiporter
VLKKYKYIPTKEQSIRRIVGSMFLMVFGIYMVCLFNETVGIISILASSGIICFYIYYLIFFKNSLSSIEIKITAGKLLNDEEKVSKL